MRISKNISLACAIAFLGAVAQAQETTVGALPSSNQSLYDEPTSLVYLSAQRTSLWPSAWPVGHFKISLPGRTLTHFDLDLLTRVWRGENFSAWIDYGIGLGHLSGELSDENHGVTLSSETASLSVIPIRLGVNVRADHWGWIAPFAGVQVTEHFYRLSSSMSGAETQGNVLAYGPVAGLQLNGRNFLNLTAIAELIAQNSNDTDRTPPSSLDLLAGVGWSF